MCRLTISLVVWNGLKYLPHCFSSIFSQTFNDYFLFILDNGSTDGSAQYIKELNLSQKIKKDKVEIIYNSKNVGFSPAHNLAINSTHSDYVLILNQDVILDHDFLKIVISFLDDHPKVGGVTGKIFQWAFTSDVQNEYLREDSLSDIIDSVGLRIFKNHRVIEKGVGEKDNGQYNTNQEVFGIPATCAIYRRRALNDIRILREVVDDKQSKHLELDAYQYFDENFFSYKEDIDLSYRMRLLGWEFWYLKDAKAYHDRTAKSIADFSNLAISQHRSTKSPFINYHSYKNHLFFLIKNITGKIFVKYGIFILWYEFKKFVWLVFNERPTLLGLVEVIKKFHVMLKIRKYVMSRKTAELVQWLE